MALLTVPQTAILRNQAGGFLPKSPLFQGITMIIAFLFVSTGLPYAWATGQVKKGRDLANILNAGLKTAIPLMTTTFMACVFIDMVNKSNIFKIVSQLPGGSTEGCPMWGCCLCASW